MAITFAQCRALGCGWSGPRAACPKVDKGPDAGGVFDKCAFCGSLDVDVLSAAGLKHEQEKEGDEYGA